MMAGLRSRSRTDRSRGSDSILRNATSSFASQLMTAGLTAVLTLFLVRALGAHQYGLFALAVSISAIAMPFADLGISSSTARFVAEHRGQDPELRALLGDALKLKLVVTGLVCAVLAGLASLIASGYGNSEFVWPLRAIALATFGQSIFLMFMWVAVALGRVAVNVRLVAAESLLEVSASMALVLAGAGATGAAFGRAVGYLLGAVIAAATVLRLTGTGLVGVWRVPSRGKVRRVGAYAVPLFAIDVSYTLSASLSVLFLGAYMGAAASGIFQAPAKLIVLIQYVGASMANAVGPRLASGPGRELNVRAVHGALRFLIGFQCLMLAPAVVWAAPITRVLLGPGYSSSAKVLTALAPYIFFCGLAPLVTTGINYLGEAGRRVPISFATLALTAGACFVLIPSHGVVGAAIATDIGFGFYTLAHIWLCRRLLKLRIGMLVWSLACGLTAAAAMGIVLASIGTNNLTAADWLKGIVGGVAAYVTMLVFTRELRTDHIVRAVATARAELGRRQRGAKSVASAGPAAEAMSSGPAPAVGGSGSGDATAPEPPLDPVPVKGTRRRFVLSTEPRRHKVIEVTLAPTAGTDARELTAPSPSEPPEHDRSLEPAARDKLTVRHRRISALPIRRVLQGARRRGDTAVVPAPGVVRPSIVAGDDIAGDQSQAARAPAWVEGFSYEALAPPEAIRRHRSPGDPQRSASAEDVPRPDASEPTTHAARAVDHAALTSATTEQPPPSSTRSPDPVGELVSPSIEDGRSEPSSGPRVADTSGLRPDVVHEIVWRLDEGAGAFELRPLDPLEAAGAPAVAESPPIRWGWRMTPAPMPEARRAHADLVERMEAAGWRRAGLGDVWFAHRFHPPNPPHPDDARRLETRRQPPSAGNRSTSG